MNDYNALERRAGVLTLQGMQSATIHTAMFMQMLAARQAGDERLANFYVERFSPDVRKADHAWLAQKPFENPAGPSAHPFVPELYQLRGEREAAEASAKAAKQSPGITQRRQRLRPISRQHGAFRGTVLFFANASGKFEQRRVRVVAFTFAVAVFAFAIVRTAMLSR